MHSQSHACDLVDFPAVDLDAAEFAYDAAAPLAVGA
jgi:hypothetical protein